MKTVANIRVAVLAAVVFFCFAGMARAQENAAPAASGKAPAAAFERTDPPVVELPAPPSSAPAAPPSAPSTAEAAKIEQVREAMDEAQRAPAATAPQRTPEFSMYRSSVRVFTALLLVLAIIFLLTYILKRTGKQTALLSGPSLATVLGKVYLEPRVRLHFVRTGGKVLVVGVTQNAIASLAEFDAESFAPEPEKARETVSGTVSGFVDQLKASMHRMEPRPAAQRDEQDADVSSLKDDIERLQKYLDDWPGSPKTQ